MCLILLHNQLILENNVLFMCVELEERSVYYSFSDSEELHVTPVLTDHFNRSYFIHSLDQKDGIYYLSEFTPINKFTDN